MALEASVADSDLNITAFPMGTFHGERCIAVLAGALDKSLFAAGRAGHMQIQSAAAALAPAFFNDVPALRTAVCKRVLQAAERAYI